MEFEWRAMKAHFGHLKAGDVTVEVCRAWVAKRRADKKHDGTIWTELGHLRTVLKWAADTRRIEHAPKVERPQKPAPKTRHLTRAECRRLIDCAVAPHIRLAIVLMLSTAARVGAILDLTWDRVDFKRGVIDLRLSDSATRKGRAVVPMNDGVRSELARAKKASVMEAHVIEYKSGPVQSIKTGFNAAVKAAGLSDVTPHVCRHTAAVHMAEAGITMDEIAQYLGHDDSRITSRVYARFSPKHLRGASNVLDYVSQPRQDGEDDAG